MLQQFLNHIEKNKLLDPSDKVLLAVSGGVDSMVMLNLFVKAGISIGVAHCNFQLRPVEAAAEGEFVRRYCKNLSIDFNLAVFETKNYADKNKVSIQVAARQLRYNFFSTVMAEKNYSKVATAHHVNDSLETFLINLSRGSGLEGFAGIPVRNDMIIRPLLFVTRADIVAYAENEGISWMEDSSNHTDDYARNLIRRKVIPLLKEINPSLEETFNHTVARLSGSALLLSSFLARFREKAVIQKDNRLVINRAELALTAAPAVVLWELLKEFNFRFDQMEKAVKTEQTGKTFYSSTHILLVDRESYILQTQPEQSFRQCLIDENAGEINGPNGTLTVERMTSVEGFSKDRSIAYLDHDKLKFPLLWRRWQDGDQFQPLGMVGKKKVSDFLIDNKIDRLTKDSVTVIESNGEIVWVVGYRISERSKVTEVTKRVVKMKIT